MLCRLRGIFVQKGIRFTIGSISGMINLYWSRENFGMVKILLCDVSGMDQRQGQEGIKIDQGRPGMGKWRRGIKGASGM